MVAQPFWTTPPCASSGVSLPSASFPSRATGFLPRVTVRSVLTSHLLCFLEPQCFLLWLQGLTAQRASASRPSPPSRGLRPGSSPASADSSCPPSVPFLQSVHTAGFRHDARCFPQARSFKESLTPRQPAFSVKNNRKNHNRQVSCLTHDPICANGRQLPMSVPSHRGRRPEPERTPVLGA